MVPLLGLSRESHKVEGTVGEKAQQVKVPASKPEDRSLAPTHVQTDVNIFLPSVISSHAPCTPPCLKIRL